MGRGQKKDPVICLCNEVCQSTIEEAIRSGADTLNKIFDRTTAGVGPCGGSCRKKLAPLLEKTLKATRNEPPAFNGSGADGAASAPAESPNPREIGRDPILQGPDSSQSKRARRR
jgi:bacterioferritin-associated ferredoxin